MARDYREEIRRLEKLYEKVDEDARRRKEKIMAKLVKLRKKQDEGPVLH